MATPRQYPAITDVLESMRIHSGVVVAWVQLCPSPKRTLRGGERITGELVIYAYCGDELQHIKVELPSVYVKATRMLLDFSEWRWPVCFTDLKKVDDAQFKATMLGKTESWYLTAGSNTQVMAVGQELFKDLRAGKYDHPLWPFRSRPPTAPIDWTYAHVVKVLATKPTGSGGLNIDVVNSDGTTLHLYIVGADYRLGGDENMPKSGDVFIFGGFKEGNKGEKNSLVATTYFMCFPCKGVIDEGVIGKMRRDVLDVVALPEGQRVNMLKVADGADVLAKMQSAAAKFMAHMKEFDEQVPPQDTEGLIFGHPDDVSASDKQSDWLPGGVRSGSTAMEPPAKVVEGKMGSKRGRSAAPTPGRHTTD